MRPRQRARKHSKPSVVAQVVLLNPTQTGGVSRTLRKRPHEGLVDTDGFVGFGVSVLGENSDISCAPVALWESVYGLREDKHLSGVRKATIGSPVGYIDYAVLYYVGTSWSRSAQTVHDSTPTQPYPYQPIETIFCRLKTTAWPASISRVPTT